MIILRNQKTGGEVGNLLELLNSLPKPMTRTEEPEEPQKPKNEQWKLKTMRGMKIRTIGRVNKTKGK